MPSLETVDAAELQTWLAHVQSKASTQRLMVALAFKNGIEVAALADWYGMTEAEIREFFDSVEEDSLVTALAETEGVDIRALADRYGVSTTTIRDWIAELGARPPADAIDVLARYSQQRAAPVFRQSRSRVHFLDYEVIEANGWSVEDADLFEKAAAEHLPPEQYGRIAVEPGETILEAAESRGFDWPYACRAGACANCAVLVKEGDIAMPGNNVLSEEHVDVLNARLTCVGVPVTEEVKLVMNIAHLDQFDDLRLPSPLESGMGPTF